MTPPLCVKHLRTSLAAACMFLAPQGVGAATLRVPFPYPTITAAMQAAAYADVIEIACGTYRERNIFVKSGVTVRSTTGDASCVTIDGEGIGGRVLLCFGVASTTRLEGLTIRGGYIAGGGEYGAGILCNGGAGPAILHCVIEANETYLGVGGGAAFVDSSPKVELCVIQGNSAANRDGQADGGGVACVRSSAEFRACSFVDNVADRHSGALHAYASPLLIEDCEFVGNIADGQGGGVFCDGSAAIIRNCVFRENSGGVGAGMSCIHLPAPHVTNCTFTDNLAPGGHGGGVNCMYDTDALFEDCRMERNGASIGGGISLRYDVRPRFERCLIVGNSSGTRGGAIYCNDGADATFSNCTIALNASGIGGSALSVQESTPVFERCILAFQTAGSVIQCWDFTVPIMQCCNLFGNAGGDWEATCVAPQEGVDGNFSADPLFCDAEGRDFTLDGGSPCLPGQHPEGADCGLIGALDRGCGATASSTTSWGSVKALYREP